MQSMSDGLQITLRPRLDTRIKVFLKSEIVNNWRALKSPAFCLRVDGRKRSFSNTVTYIISTTTILDETDGKFRRVLAFAQLHP